MKLAASSACLAVVLSASLALADNGRLAARFDSLSSTHPRLFLGPQAQLALERRIESEPIVRSLRDGIVAEADRMLATKPVERVLIGRRLLDKSRTAATRLVHLGFAWRLTGKPSYLARARAELRAIAAFSDWNPSHFLDVAEMTAAAGIGYDWCFHGLDDETRVLVRTAIVEKGLKASLRNSGWSRLHNNWNQVCNGGIAIGALAVAESEPALARDLVVRAVTTVPTAMHEYAPDGAYPEGPGYWSYGTAFNVLLIAALESALGDDFGLAARPGFLATADYYLHVSGPTGLHFNYSDARRQGDRLEPVLFWFAAKTRRAELLWNQWGALQSQMGHDASGTGGLLSPFLLFWLPQPLEPPPRPHLTSWTGGGRTPVALHRSGWETDATFVGIKGGSALAGHAHMDAGTFVMDALGVRWADDLGLQSYESLESKGINLWDQHQDGDRWKVFRLGAFCHNVMTVDGQPQRVEGQADFIVARPFRTVVNLDSTYGGQVAQARRGVELRPDRTVLVQDEIESLDRVTTLRWAMLTRANVDIKGPGHAVLSGSGRQLTLRVLEPAGAALKIYPTDPPPLPTDARNEDTRMVGFEATVPASQVRRLVVHLVPGAPVSADVEVRPLRNW